MKIEELKRFLPDYLQRKGFNLHKGGVCPACGGGSKTPCFHYDGKAERVKCFSCGFSGDLIDLIANEYGLDNSGAVAKANEIYGDKRPPIKEAPIKENSTDYSEFIKSCAAASDQTDYFKRRGLSEKTVKEFQLGYEADYKNAVVPYPGENYYFKRGTQSTFKGKARGQEPLFNLSDLYNTSKEPVFITEGQFDALSFIECGAYAVALGSTERVKAFITQLEKKPTESPVIIATDADAPGNEAAAYLNRELKRLNIITFRMTMLDGCKDPNECLTTNRTAFEKLIDDAADAVFYLEETEKTEFQETYKKEYSINYICSFIDEIINKQNNGIPTGFKELDKALDGGIFPGLFIIGAESSLGKSTIILNIAEQIAEAGTDVIYFSLEMARRELMARSISKLSYINSKGQHAFTTKQILKGDPKEYRAAINLYKPIAKNLVLYEDQTGINVNELCEYAENHKRATGKTPVVILDYLQLIAPINANDTDKIKMDYTVKALKQLSQKLNTPVIAISSVNREGYGSRVTMKDFKESGAIEFSSDVLLGLNLAVTLEGSRPSEKQVDEALHSAPREMVLEILKNRNGERNHQIKFDYYSAYNYFKENDKGLEEFREFRAKKIF